MSLFDKLLGVPDPTTQWPAVRGYAPTVEHSLWQFEAPCLGDAVETARFLGKPDSFSSQNRAKKSFDLMYASKGLRLRYVEARLAEITLYIGSSFCEEPGFVSAEPLAPDGTTLSPDTSRKRLLEIFGTPEPMGSDDEVLQFFHGNVGCDLFIDKDGRLESWVMYPND